ncbi:hypothetical protein LX32DRAFT_692634 [Colletotrichum zoysiae]|uniref:Uncharacterized protein n=1 Tax=Colletotrichum zoysiae TaxID=1216348 RepID=A0AAD9HJU8_9PEZI|nr:hypothetical protein LX32DRAFT_692634 [Colletotrichum zoysiae]
MASVPSTTLSVAQYRSAFEKIADRDTDEVIGWLTKNHTDNMPWVVRVKSEFYQTVMDAFPSYLQFISTSRNHGAVNGHAMISTSHQVQTVGEHSLPQTMYRVTDGLQPDNGIKARLGRGTDPIFMQLHVQKHLNSLGLAAKRAARGKPDVKVTKFKTSGSGWNHDVQRLWHAETLVDQFGLAKIKKASFNKEYLVEHSIPEESIVSCLDWKQDKDKLDPLGHRMRKAVKDLKDMNRRLKERSDERKKEAAEKRKAPEPKMRKNGKWVKVGVKVGRNTGA